MSVIVQPVPAAISQRDLKRDIGARCVKPSRKRRSNRSHINVEVVVISRVWYLRHRNGVDGAWLERPPHLQPGCVLCEAESLDAHRIAQLDQRFFLERVRVGAACRGHAVIGPLNAAHSAYEEVIRRVAVGIGACIRDERGSGRNSLRIYGRHDHQTGLVHPVGIAEKAPTGKSPIWVWEDQELLILLADAVPVQRRKVTLRAQGVYAVVGVGIDEGAKVNLVDKEALPSAYLDGSSHTVFDLDGETDGSAGVGCALGVDGQLACCDVQFTGIGGAAARHQHATSKEQGRF